MSLGLKIATVELVTKTHLINSKKDTFQVFTANPMVFLLIGEAMIVEKTADFLKKPKRRSEAANDV